MQFYTSDATAFKGNVFIDNIRSRKGTTETVISDFNKAGSTWSEYESGTNDNLQLSLVVKPTNTSVIGSHFANNSTVSKTISLSGKKLIIRQNSKTVSQVRVLDIMGKVLLSSNIFGRNHTIDCGKLASGNYLVEIIQGNSSEINTIILQ